MVSKTEFMNYMSAEFDNLDVNKAGKLDITELKKLNFHYTVVYCTDDNSLDNSSDFSIYLVHPKPCS